MKNYFKRKWKSKQSYILGFLFLILVWIFNITQNPELPSSSELGFFVGSILALILWLGLIVYIDIKELKVKNPQPIFVEPHYLLIGFFWLLSCAVIAFLGIFATTPISDFLLRELAADTLLANFIMSFSIFTILLLPITVYMLFLRMRYKKVVEYGTPEWYALKKKKANRWLVR